MQAIRWGFLGASRIGRGALAPAIRGAQGHELHAVAARDESRARTYAQELGMPRAYGSYEELLADPDVHAVYNALPNDQHLPLSLAALRAGKHVLCEKPLTLNAAQVRELQAASRDTGKLVLEAFMSRFHPQYDRAHEILQAGELGELRAARAGFCFTLTNESDYRWHARHGGGALYDVGCYCVMGLRNLIGREPQRAHAVQLTHGDIDLNLSGMLDFGGGLAAHFDCSVGGAFNQHLTLVGSRALLHFDWPFSSKNTPTTLTVTPHGGEPRTETFEPTDPYQAMVEHFGQAVRGERPLRWDLADAEAQARTLDALFEAARAGQVVEV